MPLGKCLRPPKGVHVDVYDPESGLAVDADEAMLELIAGIAEERLEEKGGAVAAPPWKAVTGFPAVQCQALHVRGNGGTGVRSPLGAPLMLGSLLRSRQVGRRFGGWTPSAALRSQAFSASLALSAAPASEWLLPVALAQSHSSCPHTGPSSFHGSCLSGSRRLSGARPLFSRPRCFALVGTRVAQSLGTLAALGANRATPGEIAQCWPTWERTRSKAVELRPTMPKSGNSARNGQNLSRDLPRWATLGRTRSKLARCRESRFEIHHVRPTDALNRPKDALYDIKHVRPTVGRHRPEVGQLV